MLKRKRLSVLLSAILCTVIVLGLNMPAYSEVSGFDAAIELTLNQTTTIILSHDSEQYLRFTPAESGIYHFEVAAEEGGFGQCLYDGNGNVLELAADLENAGEFHYDGYALESGSAYYLKLQTGSQEFTVPVTVTRINWAWRLLEGVLTISGTGDMCNYSFSDANRTPWFWLQIEYPDEYPIHHIVIENGITGIGYASFAFNADAASVTIPDSVTSIGDYAFFWTGLRSVSFSNVTEIGDFAFGECSSLNEFVVSGQNTAYCSADGVLFNKQKNELIMYPGGKTDTGYVVPNTVVSIGRNAFHYCSNLTSVIIPDGVTSIGDSAFSGCISLTSVTIPDSLISIGSSAFAECYGLADLTLPDSVTSIGDSAFDSCTSLTSMTIPNGVASIGSRTFAGCRGLADLTLPDSLASIGDYAFYGCSGLTNLAIPDGVAVIESSFAAFSGLTSVTIPKSVAVIGDRAFYGCNSLMDIYYRGTENDWNGIFIDNANDPLQNAAIHYRPMVNLILPDKLIIIESGAFTGIPEGTVVFIPETVAVIADDAFDSNVILTAPEGSFAAQWAEERGLTCYEQ